MDVLMFTLYQEIVMDHYHNPRNHGVIGSYNFIAQQRNSSCGDELCFTGLVHTNILISVAFKGKGCVISQAAASLLSEYVVNKSLDEIIAIDNETILAMIGMPLGPVRLMCALLPLMAFHGGIREYKKALTE
jgi:nitrogen fixation protein NifU and related proteins